MHSEIFTKLITRALFRAYIPNNDKATQIWLSLMCGAGEPWQKTYFASP